MTLEQLLATRQLARDRSGLQVGPLRRRVGGEVARRGVKNAPSFRRGAPVAELRNAGLEHLVAVEARILPQHRPYQRSKERFGIVAEGEMAGQVTRSHLYPAVPVERVEKSALERVGVGGQIVEPVLAFARQARGWHVEKAQQIDVHCTVQHRAKAFSGRWATAARKARQHALGRMGVSESVMRRFPVRVLVRGSKAGKPQRRSVGEGAAEVGWRGTFGDRVDHRLPNGAGSVSEECLGKCNGALPPAGAACADRNRRRELGRHIGCKRNEIDRMAPGGRLLRASGAREMLDHRGQYSGCVRPADQIQELEGLVDEVQCVAAVGKHAVGGGGEQHLGEGGGSQPSRDARENGSLDRIAVTHCSPMAQPPRQRLGRRRRLQRLAWAPCGPPRTILGHFRDALVEREIARFFRQLGQEIAERSEHREPRSPIRTSARSEERRLADQVERRHALRAQAEDRLGDHQPEIVRHSVTQPIAPVRLPVGMAQTGRHPYVAVTHLDRGGRQVVRPQVEAASARDIEARMMPMTGEDAVFERPTLERKAQMRAAVVHGVAPRTVRDHEERRMSAAHDGHTPRGELLECADADEPVTLSSAGTRSTR